MKTNGAILRQIAQLEKNLELIFAAGEDYYFPKGAVLPEAWNSGLYKQAKLSIPYNFNAQQKAFITYLHSRYQQIEDIKNLTKEIPDIASYAYDPADERSDESLNEVIERIRAGEHLLNTTDKEKLNRFKKLFENFRAEQLKLQKRIEALNPNDPNFTSLHDAIKKEIDASDKQLDTLIQSIELDKIAINPLSSQIVEGIILNQVIAYLQVTDKTEFSKDLDNKAKTSSNVDNAITNMGTLVTRRTTAYRNFTDGIKRDESQQQNSIIAILKDLLDRYNFFTVVKTVHDAAASITPKTFFQQLIDTTNILKDHYADLHDSLIKKMATYREQEDIKLKSYESDLSTLAESKTKLQKEYTALSKINDISKKSEKAEDILNQTRDLIEKYQKLKTAINTSIKVLDKSAINDEIDHRLQELSEQENLLVAVAAEKSLNELNLAAAEIEATLVGLNAENESAPQDTMTQDQKSVKYFNDVLMDRINLILASLDTLNNQKNQLMTKMVSASDKKPSELSNLMAEYETLINNKNGISNRISHIKINMTQFENDYKFITPDMTKKMQDLRGVLTNKEAEMQTAISSINMRNLYEDSVNNFIKNRITAPHDLMIENVYKASKKPMSAASENFGVIFNTFVNALSQAYISDVKKKTSEVNNDVLMQANTKLKDYINSRTGAVTFFFRDSELTQRKKEIAKIGIELLGEAKTPQQLNAAIDVLIAWNDHLEAASGKNYAMKATSSELNKILQKIKEDIQPSPQPNVKPGARSR